MGPSQTLGISSLHASHPSQCLSRVPVTISDPLPGRLGHRSRPPQPLPCPQASSSPSRSWSTDTLLQSPPAGEEATPGASNPKVTREEPQLGWFGAGPTPTPASSAAQLECGDGVLLYSCLGPMDSFQIEVPAAQLDVKQPGLTGAGYHYYSHFPDEETEKHISSNAEEEKVPLALL